jgi:hypothetical protein
MMEGGELDGLFMRHDGDVVNLCVNLTCLKSLI